VALTELDLACDVGDSLELLVGETGKDTRAAQGIDGRSGGHGTRIDAMHP
jgi:hypothetical protein